MREAVENPEYGPECVLFVENSGREIRCPAYPEECSYVRVCERDGTEVAYWNVDEWAEGATQGAEVMGAILGAALGRKGPHPGRR